MAVPPWSRSRSTCSLTVVRVSAADWEFACKAGSEALTAGMGMVGSGMADYVLAIGADTAQGRPGDALEYTAAAGAAALLVGPADDALAVIEATCSYVTDTPDFFRRADRAYPVHGSRFTGEPAYFSQVRHAAGHLLEQLGTKPADYTYAVFHQPNARFPLAAGKQLGFRQHNSGQGDRGYNLACRGHGSGKFGELFVIPEEVGHRRAAADDESIVVFAFGIGDGYRGRDGSATGSMTHSDRA